MCDSWEGGGADSECVIVGREVVLIVSVIVGSEGGGADSECVLSTVPQCPWSNLVTTSALYVCTISSN